MLCSVCRRTKNEKCNAYTKLIYPGIDKVFESNWDKSENKCEKLITKIAVQTLFREKQVLDASMIIKYLFFNISPNFAQNPRVDDGHRSNTTDN